MEHIEIKLDLLREKLLEMAQLVRAQVQNSKHALFNADDELASLVIAKDEIIDNFELELDKECEQILALYNPLAIDLRFILACIKISLNLERIGDHAEGVCYSFKEIKKKINPLMMEAFKLDEMYVTALQMLDDVFLSMKNNDTKRAKKIFKKDLFLNKYYHRSIKTASIWIKEKPRETKKVLHVVNIIRKLERIGDLAKNISEEIIFHHEGKLLNRNSLSSKKRKKKF